MVLSRNYICDMSKTSSSRLENIVESKCPKCHNGKLFINSNPYNFKTIFKMNARCEHCNQTFTPEPRFYDGAMFVSYAFSVMIVASVFIFFTTIFEDAPLVPMITSTNILTFILSPLSFRLSRSVWIHIFVKFDKSKI